MTNYLHCGIIEYVDQYYICQRGYIMKYCEKCKKAFISEDYKICPHCGSELEYVEIDGGKEVEVKTENNVAMTEANSSEKTETAPSEAKTMDGEKKRSRGVICILACLLLIGASLAVWNLDDFKDLRRDKKRGVDDTYYGRSKISGAVTVNKGSEMLTKYCYVPVTIMSIGAFICFCIGVSDLRNYMETTPSDESGSNNNPSSDDDKKPN